MSDLDSPVLTSVAHVRHRIAGLFGSVRVYTHVDRIFLPGVIRISDSSTSILTSNSSSSRTSLARPFRTSNRAFHLCSRRKPQWLPSCWDPRSQQPHFTCWHLAWPRSLVLSAFLCSQLHRWIHLLVLNVLCWHRRSRTGWWRRCAAGAGSWDSVAGSVIGPTPAPTGPALALSSPSHSAGFCVWSHTDTATAARRCTMPYHDIGRQVHMSMSKWALVLLRHNRRFQVFRPAFPRKSSHFLQLTDHESLFRRRAVQRSCFLDSILLENDVFACHWRLANPDSVTPSLIQIACWHGRVLVHHSSSEWQHLARVRFFSKNTHKCNSPVVLHLKSRQAPRCVSNQPRYQDAVAWQFFLQEILKRQPHRTTDTIDHSVRVFKSCRDPMAGSQAMFHQCSLDSSALNCLQQLYQHRFLVWVQHHHIVAKIVSTRYSLNAFVGQSVADILEPTSTALREGMGNIWSSSRLRSAKSNSLLGTASSVSGCCTSNAACPPLAYAPLTPASIRHVSRSLVQRSLFSWGRCRSRLCAPCVLRHRPAWLLQWDLGFRTQRVPLPVPLARPLLLSSDWVPACLLPSTSILKVWCRALSRHLWISNSDSSCSAHRILSPSMDPNDQSGHSVIRRGLSNLCVATHLSHSVLFHFRSWCRQQWSRFTRFAKSVLLAMIRWTHVNWRTTVDDDRLAQLLMPRDPRQRSIRLPRWSSRSARDPLFSSQRARPRTLGNPFGRGLSPCRRNTSLLDVSDVPSFDSSCSLHCPYLCPSLCPCLCLCSCLCLSWARQLPLVWCRSRPLCSIVCTLDASLSTQFWEHRTPAASSCSARRASAILDLVGCVPILLLWSCPEACLNSVPHTVAQVVPTPPRPDLCLPQTETATTASAWLGTVLCVPAHSSGQLLQISTPFAGSLSFVIIWSARSFVCIVSTNASWGSFIPANGISRNGFASTFTSSR